MNPTEFEAKLRAGEALHLERVPDGQWAVVRVDGRGFSSFTQAHFAKPFDPKFYELMAMTRARVNGALGRVARIFRERRSIGFAAARLHAF